MKFLALLLSFISLMAVVPVEAGQDYCRWSKRRIVIAVDRTTAYDKIDENTLKEGFGVIVRRFEAGDRVIVQSIVDEYTRSQRLFDGCVPGCPEAGFTGWLLGECRAVIARTDRSDFDRRLASSVLDILREPLQVELSDIARTVAEIGKPSPGDLPLDRLYMFTDLLENSKELPWAALRKQDPTKSVAKLHDAGVQPHLEGTKVDVFGFGRLHDPGRPALSQVERQRVETFWTRFFKDAGVSNVRIGLRLD